MPIFGSLIICIVIWLALGFSEAADMPEIVIDLMEVGKDFSLMFLAFSITAFSLIQILHSKIWFTVLAKSMTFKIFLNNFNLAVWINVVLFFGTIVGKIMLRGLNVPIQKYSILVLSFFIAFSIFWVLQIVSGLLSLYKKN